MKTPLLSSLLLAAALLPAFRASTSRAQNQLLLNGTFTATPTVNGIAQDVGRGGTGAANILDNATGATGWFTTGVSAAGASRFELWSPGTNGSPTNITGNSLELANNGGGSTTYQDVVAVPTAGMLTTFSFGYATRDSGMDAFTASVVDRTTGVTVFSQAFNPTGSFSTNQVFSTSFNVTPGDTYRIGFLDQNTVPAYGGLVGTGIGAYPANSLSAHIDQVSFVQGVPEPSTMAGLGLGMAGLCLAQRLRRSVPTPVA